MKVRKEDGSILSFLPKSGSNISYGLGLVCEIEPGVPVTVVDAATLRPRWLEVAAILMRIAATYRAQGDLEAALDCQERALDTLAHIRCNLLPDYTARRLDLMALVDEERGQRDAALEHYRSALAVSERCVSHESLGVTTTLRNIGCLYLGKQDLYRASGYCQRSLDVAEKAAPGSLDVARSLMAVASVEQTRGEPAAALQHCQRSADIADHLAPDSILAASAHCGIAFSLASESRQGQARKEYERAVQALDRARERSAADEQTRGRFASQHTSIFGGLIRTLAALGEVEAAADAAERMRARGFLESMISRSLAATAADPELAERQLALDVKRNRLYNELHGLQGEALSEDRTNQIEAELQRIKLEQEALTREIRERDPRYASLQYPEPMTVAQLRKALDPGTAVLLYVVDEKVTWLFVFGPGIPTTAHAIEVPSVALNGKVSALLDLIAERRDATALSLELGQLLLKPAADVLQRAQRVLILPDGPLWMLPVHALMMDKSTYLIDRAPVYYVPSGTVFVESRKLHQHTRPGQRSLAVGDPDFSRFAALAERGAYMPIRGLRVPIRGLYIPIRDPLFGAVESTKEGQRLVGLPYSGIEADVVAQLLAPGAEVRKGQMATEAIVRREAPGRRVIHVASHGLIDPASPMDSALVLSMPEEPLPDDDGFLKAWEVFGLDLGGCDLVTLSACETARGEVLSGEGVIGLTRAFLYAGAASVLCTQWRVADDSTAALMARFYTHYRDGDSKDLALQMAMREMRTGKMADGSTLALPEVLGNWRPEWASPYFWAPFVLVGEYLQTE